MPSGGGGSPSVGVSSRSWPASNQSRSCARAPGARRPRPGTGPRRALALLGHRPGERLDVVRARARGRGCMPSWSSVAACPAYQRVMKVSTRSNGPPCGIVGSVLVDRRGRAPRAARRRRAPPRPPRRRSRSRSPSGSVEQADPQLARVGAELLDVGPQRRRRDVGIAGRRPVDRVEDRRRRRAPSARPPAPRSARTSTSPTSGPSRDPLRGSASARPGRSSWPGCGSSRRRRWRGRPGRSRRRPPRPSRRSSRRCVRSRSQGLRVGP